MAEKSKIPAIRFAGFTEAWEQRKLGELGTTFTGLSGKSKGDFGHGDARFITYINVFSNPIADLRMTESVEIDFKQNCVKQGDVFFTTSSETPEEVGMSCVMPENIDNMYLNSFCFGYRPIEKFDLSYLAYALRSTTFRKGMIFLAQGISRYNISKNKAMDLEISVPSLEEQGCIGRYFNHLDNLITLHQRKYDKLVNVKKAMLEKMFPKDGADVPEIRFKGFTEAWEQRKFGELSSSFEYGLNAASKEFDGKNKYIRITDIDDDSHDFNQKDITSPDIDLSNAGNFKLKEGDILFARTGASVGKTYIYKSSHGLVYYAGFLIRARIKEEYNPEFVFQNTLTKGYQKFIKVTSMRSGQPGINALEYYQFESMVPEKAEQSKIGKYFRHLDNLITLHQRKLEKLKNLKKACLEKMFV